MSKQATRLTFAVLSLAIMIATASGQTNLTAKANNFQPQPSAANGGDNETDRGRDGLIGPVRRVRTEVVKLSNAGGKTVEDNKRTVLETAEYDLKGSKTRNQYFPVEGATLTGREVYKYDEKGNISEMTLVSADGSLVSKEVYKYEYDSVGNWVKMTTSVAVVENGKIGFEASEMTYRTIFYYLDASMAKVLQPGATIPPVANSAQPDATSSRPSATVNDAKLGNSVGAAVKQPENRSAATLPPSISVDKLKVSSVQPSTPDFRGLPADTNKRIVVTGNDAPPAPRPLLKPVSSGVLNGKALSLPTPVYPDVARRMRTEGVVQVEVVVDENGKVVSARALSGPGMLRDAAVKAASLAHFSPTKLSGMPVKVTGLINYNFTVPK